MLAVVSHQSRNETALSISIARKCLNSTMPSVSDMKHPELSSFTGENETSTTTLKNVPEVAYSVKHALGI